MHFSFDQQHAIDYGLNEAILIHNFRFWVIHNHAHGKNHHEGRTWTYNSVDALCQIFPFWGAKTIRTTIKSLIDQGVLIKSNFNEKGYDRTSWYAFSDNDILGLKEHNCSEATTSSHLPKRANPFAQKGKPIPDIKQLSLYKKHKDLCSAGAEPRGSFLNKQSKEILEYLNELTSKNFQPTSSILEMIKARLKEYKHASILRYVVKEKVAEWKCNEKMCKYLRPKTLFARSNFDNYYGQISKSQMELLINASENIPKRE